MKKFLMIAFAFVALLATVSCSKDDDKKSDPPTIQGTLWESMVDYNVPIVGSGTIEAQLYFKTDNICRVDIDLPATLMAALSMLGGGDLNFDSGEYEYTFDGKKVVFQAAGGIELEYTGNTLVFHIPSQYSSVASIIGINEVVFHKQ
jgi:hypothetical protein